MGILRVLIADPNDRQRRQSKKFLNRFREVRVVGDVRDGVEAYTLARVLHPDLVISEISMPGMNGIYLARILKYQSPSIRILILTEHVEDTYRVLSELVGVDAYVRKDEMGNELRHALLNIERRLPLFVDLTPAGIAQTHPENHSRAIHHIESH